MIVVKGYGQMCNNILQYAHAYAWGRENKVKVISMRFSYKYQYFNICNRKDHRLLVYLISKFLIKTKLIPCICISEPAMITTEVRKKLSVSPFIALDGWQFRFPDLFMKYREEIKDLFTIKSKVRERVDNYFTQRQNLSDLCLAVHIRRGDYANFMEGKYFFNDNVYIRYIKEFMSFFPQKRISVYISTNDKKLDIAYYREILQSDNIYLFRGNEGEDLYLLSKCDYIIGPKSTFSLVASFYNDIPIYHIMSKDKPLSLKDFKRFKDLYMYA